MTAHHDDRYLSHMEDEPGFRTTRHRTVEEASEATIQGITERLDRNGCGDGLVYDRHEGKIVAIYGHTGTTGTEEGGFDYEVGLIAFPDEDILAEMTILTAAWDAAMETKDYPEFIWQTNADF